MSFVACWRSHPRELAWLEGVPSTLQQVQIERAAKNSKPRNGLAGVSCGSKSGPKQFFPKLFPASQATLGHTSYTGWLKIDQAMEPSPSQ